MLVREKEGEEIRGVRFQGRSKVGPYRLAGDAAKLLGCATHVVDHLVDAVKASVPPVSEIDTLQVLLMRLQ